MPGSVHRGTDETGPIGPAWACQVLRCRIGGGRGACRGVGWKGCHSVRPSYCPSAARRPVASSGVRANMSRAVEFGFICFLPAATAASASWRETNATLKEGSARTGEAEGNPPQRLPAGFCDTSLQDLTRFRRMMGIS